MCINTNNNSYVIIYNWAKAIKYNKYNKAKLLIK